MNKKYILFDLDGTLTDSGEGITKSVVYALERFGIKAEPHEVTSFIGPPLRQQFSDIYGFDKEQAKLAVELFRERYTPIGVFENKPFDGIPELLRKLKNLGFTLIVATSKPQELADRVLTHFDLMRYFDYACGSDLDGKCEKKEDIIRLALKTAGIKSLDDVVMIGDTCYDILGARKVGIDVIAVAYGYGEKESLRDADFVADSVDDLEQIIINE